MKKNVDIHIYCDGGCEPNPGQCASGIIVYKNNSLEYLFYGLYREEGTNNIAELNALLYSLKLAKNFIEKNNSVQILCDSQYAINCITQWSYGWKANGWKKKKDEEIKNLEIIKESHFLYELIKSSVIISHVKAHSGFEGNELADRMTIVGIKEKEALIKEYKNKDVQEILKITVR